MWTIASCETSHGNPVTGTDGSVEKVGPLYDM